MKSSLLLGTATSQSLPLVLALLLFSLPVHAQVFDPVYEGKALSDWLLGLNEKLSETEVQAEARSLHQYDPDAWLKAYDKKRARDAAAINRLGTSALPTLLVLLTVTDRDLKSTLSRLKSKELHQAWWRNPQRVEDVRQLALAGFKILGTNADSAVPQLVRILNDSEARFEAAEALSNLGPKGFSALTNALTASSPSVRGAVIWAFRQETSADPRAVDAALISCLQDPDPVNRHNAAQFVTGRDPSALAGLIRMLDSRTDYLAVEGAADGLRKFGPAAKAAVPKLLAIFTNSVATTDRQIARTWGSCIMDALKAIDSTAAAQAEAFLVNSGPYNYARNGFTTTRLPTAKELLVGGYLHTDAISVSNQVLACAQLCDPVTGKWSGTGDLNVPRYSHTATLLHNGAILVAGGTDAKGRALAATEIWDPRKGSWQMSGSLNHARFYHSATLQADGKVVVTGGHDGLNPRQESEVYDPATGTWTIKELDIPKPRGHP